MLAIADYMDKQAFRSALDNNRFGGKVEAIFHQGACSDTMVTDGAYMMDNNFTFSKVLLHYAVDRQIPFIYASSAAVYGNCPRFVESPENEKPLNVYGYSKLLFDQYVRRRSPRASQPSWLRYFNVYGPNEQHKGRMASMVYQIYRQLCTSGVTQLFAGTDGSGDGEQQRDFVFVADVVEVNLAFLDGPVRNGVVNVGTGVMRRASTTWRVHWIGLLQRGTVRYIPFPAELQGKYQNYTQADLTALRGPGYQTPFTSLEQGIASYYQHLLGEQPGY